MTFEVEKSALSNTRVVDDPPRALAEGEARLSVRTFGLSANNITYALFGDSMRYWQFFPAGADGTDTLWGRIPVWGFAEVADANGTGLTEGETIWGYMPMGPELIVVPTTISESAFTDDSPHRASLLPGYNAYTRSAADAVYSADTEALQMLFRPLFFTDFVIDDYLADHDFFGAGNGAVVLSSASSKTAFGCAYLLHARDDGPEVIGLTSPTNVAFTEGLGVYDRVLSYDQVDALDAEAPTVYVDVAGNAEIRHAVHTHVTGLQADVTVGGTHRDKVREDSDLPGPTPLMLFEPDENFAPTGGGIRQMEKRSADWGPDGLAERFATAWHDVLPLIRDWVTIEERIGIDAIERTYREVLDGTADPSVAFVCSP